MTESPDEQYLPTSADAQSKALDSLEAQRSKRNADRFTPRWMRALRALAVDVGVVASLLVFGSALLAEHDLLAELASHFLIQYCAALLISVLALLALKHWRAACIFAPALLFASARLLPYYGAPPNNSFVKDDGKTISMVAFNVNRDNTNYGAIVHYLLSTDADVISLEEVTPRAFGQLAPALARIYPFRIARPQEDAFGIAMFSRYPIQRSEVVNEGSEAAPLPAIVAEIGVRGIPLLVLGVHPPPPVSDSMLALRTKCDTAFREKINALAPDSHWNCVIMGDLNCTPWSPYFWRICDERVMRDTARGFGLQTTWPDNNWLLHIPIDHILASSNFATVARERGPTCGSDHHAVYAKLALIN